MTTFQQIVLGRGPRSFYRVTGSSCIMVLAVLVGAATAQNAEPGGRSASRPNPMPSLQPVRFNPIFQAGQEEIQIPPPVVPPQPPEAGAAPFGGQVAPPQEPSEAPQAVEDEAPPPGLQPVGPPFGPGRVIQIRPPTVEEGQEPAPDAEVEALPLPPAPDVGVEALPLPPAPSITVPRPPLPPVVTDQDVLVSREDDEDEPFITPVAVPLSEVVLVVGRAQLFEARRPFTRVVVDNPGVVEIQVLDPEKPEPRLINLYGIGFGTATLTLFDEEDRAQAYRVRVIIDTQDLEKRINSIFAGSDIRVFQVAQQIILEGQVPDSKTMTDVMNLVQSELRITGQASVGSLASSIGFGPGAAPGGQVGGGQMGALQVPGTAASPAGAQPGLILVNRIRLPGPRQIMLKVKIAELNRDAIRQFGVNFQRAYNDNVIGSVIGSGIAAIGTTPGEVIVGPESQLFGIFDERQFSLFVNALRSNGLARILAEPTLVTLDGQPARFLAGGSFPFPVPQAGIGGITTITIQFRDFGAVLQFLPHIEENGMIRLDVEPVFSELDFLTGTTVAGTTVPGLTERSARTVVELREGQTLAIAGLLQSRTRGVVNRVPLLGDLPVVGPWFSQQSIETRETELVVLVTPELVAPMDKGKVPPAPGDNYMEPNDLEFFFLGRLEGRTGNFHRATTRYLDPFDIMKHFESEDYWVVGPHGYAD